MACHVKEERWEYYRKTGLWSDQTLLDYWNKAAAKWQDREYVADDQGSRLTYGALDRKASALAGWMQRQGVKTGDMVSLQCTPRAEFVITVIACFKLGAVVVPMKMRTGAEEWIRLMQQVHSKMHFCISSYHGDRMADFVESCEKELDFAVRNVYIGGAVSDGESFDQIFREDMDPEPVRTRAGADDIAVILFTSGTTKGSRGVLLTHNQVIASEQIFNRQLSFGEGDAIFMPAPLSHATGFHHGIVSTFLYGGRLVLQEHYAPDTAMEMMRREQCTYSMGATPFLYDYIKLMDQGVKKPEFLKFYICGGAPVSHEIICHAWDAYRFIVCECYGSTESVPHILVPPEHAVEIGGRFSGVVPEGIEVRIVDKQGNDVAPGQVGEEISRGPNVFLGYLNDEESTRQAIDDDGWYYSGDLCCGDGNGWIKICGRKKDIIVRGGENLNINEIEANLLGCPGVAKAAAVGMKDERLGERVCAFIVPEPGVPLVTREAIVACLEKKKVSKWLWPERIEYIDDLYYTDSGKIKRYLLQQELERRIRQEAEAQHPDAEGAGVVQKAVTP